MAITAADWDDSNKRRKPKGLVIVRGKNGITLRTKVKPYNPRTSYQQEVRGHIVDVARLWQSLSHNQMQMWERAANYMHQQYPKDKWLSGVNFFKKCNLLLLKIGVEPKKDFPGIGIKPYALEKAKVIIIRDEDYEDIILTYKPELEKNQYLVISATEIYSRGVSRPDKGKYRKIGVLSGGGYQWGNGISIMKMYDERFGWRKGIYGKIGFMFKIVDGITGLESREVEEVIDLTISA